MPKAVERWLCEKCGTLHGTMKEAERCEKHHRVVVDTEFVYSRFSHFPFKVILTVVDPETGEKWKVPAELSVDEEGENWERVTDENWERVKRLTDKNWKRLTSVELSHEELERMFEELEKAGEKAGKED